jgi:cytochrome c553
MKRNILQTAYSLVLSVVFVGLAAHTQAAEPLEYNRDIRPILADNCFACHGADSASRKADLRLDRREAAIDMGAITEGEPDDSELIARIFSDDPDIVMPPPETKKKLTAAQKDAFKQWIAAGAKYQPHWSFIVPKKAEPPSVKNEAWVKNAIDRFVLAKLEASGLSPASEADPHALIRRLHLDITGLPPAPEDVAKFVSDYEARRDAALAEWIDRLMQLPAWGEHRARYWLDAARYGDTHGMHFDNYREMWPYRDWVIRAFNANQPFDQFTVEQIAGDLLTNPTIDQLVATGFQRCNITTNEGGTIDEENLANYATDRVQTFGWVYLGLTTNCSQCHDHKFDPITMKDYYSLAAFFRNTTQGAKDGNVKDGRGPVVRVPTEADRPRWNALPGEIAAATTRRDEHKNNARGQFDQWLASVKPDALDDGVSEKDLLVHVPLNEGAGNEVNNLCESPAKFTATGNVVWNPDGKFGPAPVMKLGATFDLGSLGDFEKDQKFSYGAWIKAARNGVFGGILARMDEKGGYRGWDLWQNDRDVAVHIIDAWPDNGLKVITTGAVLKPGQWQHIFVTYDGSAKPGGIRIYVDGKEQALKVEKDTLKPDATIRTQTPLRIGQRSDTQVFDGGGVQDVRIYSRNLAAEEVKAIAEVAPLRAILASASEQRTPEQQAALFDYYLVTQDPEYLSRTKAVADLEAEREAIQARSPVTHIQQERPNSPAMAFILARGAYDKPGEKVEATTPPALHPMPAGAPKNRLGLAEWLVDPANPLTARVTVNRFWQEVFGQGIVATPEDFGVMGAQPSHPELLDWLAVEFRESGWDVKKLFKLMLMSATYRQAAVTTPEKLEKDRGNVLLSRGPRFRMDAEMVRDYALAASGLLSEKMYGPSTKPYQPQGIWDIVGLPGGDTRNYVQDKGENLYRRTLYNFWKRMAPPPNLEALNAPSREVCTVRRERTNTPLAALVTLNDPQFVEAARHLAQNALTAGNGEEAKVIDFIAQRVLCRPVNDKERVIISASARQLLTYYKSKPDDAQALIAVGESKADDKLDVAELAAWTMVCNQVLNLDEVLNK